MKDIFRLRAFLKSLEINRYFIFLQLLTTLISILTNFVGVRLNSMSSLSAFYNFQLRVEYFFPLIVLGITSSIFSFLTQKKSNIYYYLFQSSIIATTLGLINLFIFDNSMLFSCYFILGLVGILPTIFFALDDCKFMVISFLINIIISVSFIFIQIFSFEKIILFRIAISILIYFLSIYRILKMYSFAEFIFFVNLKDFYKILKSNSAIALSSFVSGFTLNLPIYFLSKIENSKEIAVFGIISKEFPLIAIISSLFLIVYNKKFTRQSGLFLKDLNFSFKASSLIFIPIVFFFVIWTKPFLALIYGNKVQGFELNYLIFQLPILVRVLIFSSIFYSKGDFSSVLIRSFLELAIYFILLNFSNDLLLISVFYTGIVFFISIPFNLILLRIRHGLNILSHINLGFYFKVIAVSVTVGYIINMFNFLFIYSAILYFLLTFSILYYFFQNELISENT